MKNQILFLLISMVTGVLIACFLAAKNEPQWKAEAEVAICAPNLEYFPDKAPRDIPVASDSDFRHFTELMKNEYIVNRITRRLGNIDSDNLKHNRKISVNHEDKTVGIYYTCNDPQVALQVVRYHVDEAYWIVQEVINKKVSSLFESMEIKIRQKTNEISELRSQLDKLPGISVAEQELVNERIKDEENSLGDLIKNYELLKSQDFMIIPKITMVLKKDARLVSERPLGKNYFAMGAIGAASGLCIGFVAMRISQLRKLGSKKQRAMLQF